MNPRYLLLCFICVSLLPASAARAQFREDSREKVQDASSERIEETVADNPPSDGKKMLYLAGSALGFGLFDYVGFNLARGTSALPLYRAIQALVQIGITWFLYEAVGLPTAIGFNLIWWSWGADVIYYGYTELFNAGGKWERRGAFEQQIMGNHCTWAWWTPVGIAQGMDRNKVITGDTLVAQSLVGAVLAFTITLSF